LILLFLVLLAIVLIACALAFAFVEKQRKKQVTGVLRAVSGEDADEPKVTLLSEQAVQKTGLATALEHFQVEQKLQTNISQAGLTWDSKQLLVAMLVLGGLGFLLAFKFNILLVSGLSNVALALILGSLPYIYVRKKRKKRLAEFEEQFPEALD